jgi:hypothetical protein
MSSSSALHLLSELPFRLLSLSFRRCPEIDKFLISYVMIRLKLLHGKALFFVNDIDRGYRLKLFLERFCIKAAVLNSELPLTSRYIYWQWLFLRLTCIALMSTEMTTRRLHIIEQFNRGIFDYLIATDESSTGSPLFLSLSLLYISLHPCTCVLGGCLMADSLQWSLPRRSGRRALAMTLKLKKRYSISMIYL